MGVLLGHVGSVVVVALVLGHAAEAVAGEPVAVWRPIFGFLKAADCFRAGRKVERDGCVGEGSALRFGIGGGDDDKGKVTGRCWWWWFGGGGAFGWWRPGEGQSPSNDYRKIATPRTSLPLTKPPFIQASILIWRTISCTLVPIGIFSVISAILFSIKRADVTAPDLYIKSNAGDPTHFVNVVIRELFAKVTGLLGSLCFLPFSRAYF